MPIAAYAQFEDRTLRLSGRVCAADGSTQLTLHTSVTIPSELDAEQARALAEQAGLDMAQSALEQGATSMLEVQ
jgi:porphobilinogen deaminase